MFSIVVLGQELISMFEKLKESWRLDYRDFSKVFSWFRVDVFKFFFWFLGVRYI